MEQARAWANEAMGALHRFAQKGLPMILFEAGLPQLAAKSYADPIRGEGAGITAEALAVIGIGGHRLGWAAATR